MSASDPPFSDLAGDLLSVAAEVVAAAGCRDRFELLADRESLGAVSRQSLPALALFVAEAVRNAIRHSHPTGIPGKIAFACRAGPNGGAIVEIRDDGVGLPEDFDEARHGGAGFRLMRGAAARLGARMTFRSSPLGLSLRLRLPKSALERSPVIAAPPTDLLDDLPTGVYLIGVDGGITYFNHAAVRLWGRRPALGEKWCGSWKLHTKDGAPLAHVDCPMAIALREGRELHGTEAVVERPDGSRVPLIVFPTLLRDAEGAVTGAVNVMVEIGARKRNEERQHLLAGELKHRSKNLLAIARAVVAQSLRGAQLDDVRSSVLGRLKAIGETYDKLNDAGWRGASLAEVVQSELGAFGDRVDVEGPDVSLTPRAAQNFALAVHELATNAVKHGALSAPGGRVTVVWSIAGEDSELRFRWVEQDGPPVVPPAQKGFGSVVLEQLVAQDFGRPARILFAPDGLTYEVTAALAEIAGAPSAERQAENDVPA